MPSLPHPLKHYPCIHPSSYLSIHPSTPASRQQQQHRLVQAFPDLRQKVEGSSPRSLTHRLHTCDVISSQLWRRGAGESVTHLLSGEQQASKRASAEQEKASKQRSKAIRKKFHVKVREGCYCSERSAGT